MYANPIATFDNITCPNSVNSSSMQIEIIKLSLTTMKCLPLARY